MEKTMSDKDLRVTSKSHHKQFLLVKTNLDPLTVTTAFSEIFFLASLFYPGAKQGVWVSFTK